MASTSSVTVAILAGGLGTRLGALARGVPKPMIEVAGRPFLDFVVRSFVDCGLKDIVLLTGHLGEQIEAHFGDGRRAGARIRYSRESSPIGTGGAVRQARGLLGDWFVLTYGDVLRRFDYDRFVRDHARPAISAYASDIGNTDIRDGRVTRFDKKARLPYMEAGFSLMPSRVIDFLGDTGSFEETVFPQLAAAGDLDAEIVDHDFVEIGTPEALDRARKVLS
jgi:D-glycero-D-manno-heptose 1,7-bisphosphate phosphatase